VNLQFRNTLTREVETVRPLTGGRLGIYVCGPTVYAAPHLGHARSAVVFDVLRRFLEALGWKVTLVRNITDIDDKLLQRARAEAKDYRSLADRYLGEYNAAMRALNVRPPDAAPRATAFIPSCQAVIARIHHHGHAYRKGDSVYFDTRSCPAYGCLSARRAIRTRPCGNPPENPDKRHPDDFVLWKGRQDGEPFWESPWGPGRPGWHIECTAMSHALLGTPFDIHGGGCDLIFPHHENEIAQCRAAFGRPPAEIWLHHGMVTVADAKMAKSKGNAPSLQRLLQTWHPEAVRLFLLSRPYRSDLPFTPGGLDAAARHLDRLYALAGRLQAMRVEFEPPAPGGSPLWQRFMARMASDGDIPGSLAVLFEAVRDLNRAYDSGAPVGCGAFRRTAAAAAADFLYLSRHVLGLLQTPPAEYAGQRRTAHGPRLPRPVVERLVARRQAARQIADWPTADRLQSVLAKHGIRVRDQDGATRWRRTVRRDRFAN
jgi:cysteinyl-tRNA synthetase